MSPKKEILNISTGRFFDPFIALFLGLITFIILNPLDISNTELVISIMTVCSVYFILSELITGKKTLANIIKNKIDTPFAQVLKNTFIKWCGVVLGILFMFFMYWFIPEYDNLKYFTPIQEAFPIILPVILPLSFFAIFLSEYFLGHKNDGTYNLGLFALLQLDKINWSIFRDGFLEWLIRTIFLTLNFTSAVLRIDALRVDPMVIFRGNFMNVVLNIETAIFLIIIIIILPGYLFSWRLIDNDTRKIDSTWFAWTLLLICYQPFVGPVFQDTFKYTPDLIFTGGTPLWEYYFSSFPLLIYLYGSSILFFSFIHFWGEAALGVRASNLSHKGLITNGPFLYTKHPVYLSKCFAWFLIGFPFFNGVNFMESLQLGLAFLVICAIYIGRSISEERMLASDGDYVKYALYMDKHAVFAFVGRLFPVMTFEWKYNYWKKHGQIKYE